MTNTLSIMVVDDEPEIRRFIGAALLHKGYKVIALESASEALKFCAASPPDLLILDLALPDIDGKDVIKALREWSALPIIVLSARSHESEKVLALEMGADDYLAKPFGTAELLARINVALRHANRRQIYNLDIYSFHELQVDFMRREARLQNKTLHLTPTEYDLISCSHVSLAKLLHKQNCCARFGVKMHKITTTILESTFNACDKN